MSSDPVFRFCLDVIEVRMSSDPVFRFCLHVIEVRMSSDPVFRFCLHVIEVRMSSDPVFRFCLDDDDGTEPVLTYCYVIIYYRLAQHFKLNLVYNELQYANKILMKNLKRKFNSFLLLGHVVFLL